MRQKTGIVKCRVHRSQDPFRGVFFVATSKNVIDAMCGWVGSTAEGRGGSYVEAWPSKTDTLGLPKYYAARPRANRSISLPSERAGESAMTALHRP